jgi:hypothetical protein
VKHVGQVMTLGLIKLTQISLSGCVMAAVGKGRHRQQGLLEGVVLSEFDFKLPPACGATPITISTEQASNSNLCHCELPRLSLLVHLQHNSASMLILLPPRLAIIRCVLVPLVYET